MACPEEGDLGGSIAFATVGRPQYGFDIFSLPLPPEVSNKITAVQDSGAEQNSSISSRVHAQPDSSRSSDSTSELRSCLEPESLELRHTDGQSVNFTGHFVPGAVGHRWLKHAGGGKAPGEDASSADDRETSPAVEHLRSAEDGQKELGLVFISERGGSPSIYVSAIDVPRNDEIVAERSQTSGGAPHDSACQQAGSETRGARRPEAEPADDVSGGGVSSGDVSSGDVSGGMSGDRSSGGVSSDDVSGDVSGGAGVVALTNGFWMEDRPGMTPDGGRLVFSSTREDSEKAHLVRKQGTASFHHIAGFITSVFNILQSHVLFLDSVGEPLCGWSLLFCTPLIFIGAAARGNDRRLSLG